MTEATQEIAGGDIWEGEISVAADVRVVATKGGRRSTAIRSGDERPWQSGRGDRKGNCAASGATAAYRDFSVLSGRCAHPHWRVCC